MFPYLRLLSLSLVLGLPLAGCDTDVPEDKPSTSDADADSDADTDADTDADSDADSDSDTDADEGAAVDEDDDGFTVDDGDCDDTDDSVHPDADELCDGIDNNCDDSIDNDATDATEWFADVDADGYGNPDASEWACEQPESHVADAADCDDNNGAIHPAADELCDLGDNDCDGLIDAEDDTLGDGFLAYTDFDGDGFGAPESETTVCMLDADQTEIGADCDDTNMLVNPDAFEVCDGIDNDCDSLVDDEDDDRVGASTFYADVDEDGYGDVGSTTLACWVPAGFVTDDNDCDDSDSEVSPAGTDYCGDDVDSNCSGDESDCYDLTINEVHDMIVCDGTPEALRVSGDRFDISYNINGLWNDPDTEMGLQISSDGTDFVDVTWPGTHYAVTSIGHTSDEDEDGSWDESFYSDGAGGDALDDLIPDCANSVEIGDVIGVIHEYTFDFIQVKKTELWKRDQRYVRVWYEVTNISDTSVGFPAIHSYFDPDIDSDVHGTTDTNFYMTGDNRYLTATGPDSGWTISVGKCGEYGNVRGWDPPSSWMVDPTDWEPTCNPDGTSYDGFMGWMTGDWSIEAGETMEDGYILTTSTGSWDSMGAAIGYATMGPDLCEVDEVDWTDSYMTSTVCDSGSLPDLPDLPDSPEF